MAKQQPTALKNKPQRPSDHAQPRKRVSSGLRFKTQIVSILKTPSGIFGLDEITGGGLPVARTTLVSGGAGCGKTFFAMQFLVRGATEYGEPGVFIAFEETRDDLAKNAASLGFSLEQLIARKKLAVDHIQLERRELQETGEYDLGGLLIRLRDAIESVGAKRVVLDTIELLFGGLTNEAVVRSELRALLQWLKEQGVTSIVTCEHGEGSLTRLGFEPYVCDCVIALDHRVTEQIATRRLRVVKYRGSPHGTNEYHFLIDQSGISVLPVTSLGLNYAAPHERITSGVPRLDTMLGGKGFFRGSSILISGTAGSGKTSLAAYMADATCRRGERALVFCFEESPDQFLRNMRSIGLHLRPWLAKKLLRFYAARPSLYGLEMHLATTLQEIREFQPHLVVLDPITAFSDRQNDTEVRIMLVRLLDYLKGLGITGLLTNLNQAGEESQGTNSAISSLIDTWLMLTDNDSAGERNRILRIAKSRGMAHSNQLREYQITSHGIQMLDVYLGGGRVLTGSARQAQEARDAAEQKVREEEIARQKRALRHKRQALENQIAAMRAGFEAERVEAERLLEELDHREQRLVLDRLEQARSRWADSLAK